MPRESWGRQGKRVSIFRKGYEWQGKGKKGGGRERENIERRLKGIESYDGRGRG